MRILPALLLATLAGAVAACSDPSGSTPPPEPPTPGLHVVSGPAPSDTARAVPTAQLMVRLRAANGDAIAGAEVRFDPLLTNTVYGPTPTMGIGGGSGHVGTTVVDTTDASGTASVTVGFGHIAGPGGIVVTSPAAPNADTARFTVLPASPRTVRGSPRDSAVYVGRGYTLRGITRDAYDNPRNDAVEFAVVSGPIQIASGVLTATALGRGVIVARHAALTDTMYVSVVPPGRIALRTYDGGNGGPGDVVAAELDGSGYHSIGRGADNRVSPFGSQNAAQGVAWSPDGAEVAAAYGNLVLAMDPATRAERLVLTTSLLVRGERFSRDGQWIFFGGWSDAAQSASLYRVRRDGTGMERIGAAPSYGSADFAPSPSPDGRYVAFVTNRPLSVAPARSVEIFDLQAGAATGVKLPGSYAAWSPTGDRLAYADADNRLHVVTPAGAEVRLLGDAGAQVNWIDWSPDGQWLIVGVLWGRPPTLVNTSTGMMLPLGWAATDGEAAWHP